MCWVFLCDGQYSSKSVRTLPLWNPARHRSAIAQVGSPKLFRQDRFFVESDEKVRAEKPERAEEQNCLRLLEEAKASEEEQATKVHRIADDSVGTDGNKPPWSIKRSRRSATLNDEQDNAGENQAGASNNGEKS